MIKNKVVRDFRACESCLSQINFTYKGREFIVDFVNKKVVAYENLLHSQEFVFDSMDDFFAGFVIDGKRFIDFAKDIEEF